MNKTKRTRQEKGITLVALIITIIVLLILAVVAIRAVQEDGIITKAKDAKEKYSAAQEKEQIQLALNEWQIQKNYPTTQAGSFKDFMIAKLAGVASVSGDKILTVTMEGTETVYTVSENEIFDGLLIPKEQKYFTFTLNTDDKTATITGINENYRQIGYYDSDSYVTAIKDGDEIITDIVIPSKYVDTDGTEYTVTTIGARAFARTCY